VQNNKKRGLPKNFRTRYEKGYIEDLINEKIVFKVKEIELEKIKPDPSQPRKHFDENSLKELASSIKERGVIEPILVRKENNSYVIISGERRWRASAIAGKKTIPAIELNAKDKKEIREIQIIENLQREDITPLERAKITEEYLSPFTDGRKIKTLLINYRMGRKVPEGFAHAVSALCKITGKKPITLIRWISLLDLPDELQKKVDDPDSPITSRHIEQLLKLSDTKEMLEIAKLIEQENLSSEDVKNKITKRNKTSDPIEKIIKEIKRIKKKKNREEAKKELLKIKEFIEELISSLN